MARVRNDYAVTWWSLWISNGIAPFLDKLYSAKWCLKWKLIVVKQNTVLCCRRSTIEFQCTKNSQILKLFASIVSNCCYCYCWFCFCWAFKFYFWYYFFKILKMKVDCSLLTSFVAVVRHQKVWLIVITVLHQRYDWIIAHIQNRKWVGYKKQLNGICRCNSKILHIQDVWNTQKSLLWTRSTKKLSSYRRKKHSINLCDF